jgi:hypothetical protein
VIYQSKPVIYGYILLFIEEKAVFNAGSHVYFHGLRVSNMPQVINGSLKIKVLKTPFEKQMNKHRLGMFTLDSWYMGCGGPYMCRWQHK